MILNVHVAGWAWQQEQEALKNCNEQMRLNMCDVFSSLRFQIIVQFWCRQIKDALVFNLKTSIFLHDPFILIPSYIELPWDAVLPTWFEAAFQIIQSWCVNKYPIA